MSVKASGRILSWYGITSAPTCDVAFEDSRFGLQSHMPLMRVAAILSLVSSLLLPPTTISYEQQLKKKSSTFFKIYCVLIIVDDNSYIINYFSSSIFQ